MKKTNTQNTTLAPTTAEQWISRQSTTNPAKSSRKTRQISTFSNSATTSIAWISLILCICFSSQQGVHGIPLGQGQSAKSASQEMTDLSVRNAAAGQGQAAAGSPQAQLEEFYPLDNEYTRRFGELTRFDEKNMNVNANGLNIGGMTDTDTDTTDDVGDVDNDVVLGEAEGENRDNGQQMQQQPWEMVSHPKFYIHTELEQQSIGNNMQQQQQQDSERSRVRGQRREKRNAGPSLSIVNPLDVLRQRLLIEIARRRFHSKNQQINANTEYLKTIGRRRR